MAKADLTAQRLRELFHYEPTTGVFTRLKAFHRHHLGEAGYFDRYGYRVIGIDGAKYFAHRLAFLYMTGSFPAKEVDHVDSSRDNNAWTNLRDVSHGVNMENRTRAHANSKSGLLGVCMIRGRWTAHIQIDGKMKAVGTAPTAELAHDLYLQAKRKLHEGCTL